MAGKSHNGDANPPALVMVESETVVNVDAPSRKEFNIAVDLMDALKDHTRWFDDGLNVTKQAFFDTLLRYDRTSEYDDPEETKHDSDAESHAVPPLPASSQPEPDSTRYRKKAGCKDSDQDAAKPSAKR